MHLFYFVLTCLRMEIKEVTSLIFFLLLNSFTEASDTFRILGGSDALIEDHPWDISLQSSGQHFCGGAIIDYNKVLTAAHCFYNRPVDDTMTAVAGATNLDSDEYNVKTGITKVVMHENYDPATFDYDIAVITLDRYLPFSNKINKIELPEKGYEIPVDTEITISGWGIAKRKESSAVPVLQSTKIKAISWIDCLISLAGVNQFTERMICAGVPGGERDTCQGDSGGPIEIDSTVVGVVSWGAGCGNAGYPGAYTKISYFRSWIDTLLGHN